jgi:diguanylate cyclase (GGDEF)-like protein
MLEAWGLAETIYRPVLMHHSPDEDDDYYDSSMVVGLSSRISSVYHGWHSARQLLNVKHDLAKVYGLADDECDRMIDMIGAKSRDVISLFQIDPGDMKPFSWIVQEANSELGRLNLSYEQLVLELKQQKEKADRLAAELVAVNERYRELAFRDELTGLHNRRFFLESLEAELHRGMRYERGFSMVMIDLDRFKELNDRYGQKAGDRVLAAISDYLRAQVRRCDIVARYGGDEFALILPETDLKGARVLAQRLCDSIHLLRVRHGHEPIAVTVSIGSVCFHPTENPTSVVQLIELCDHALSRAKKNGRNRVEIEF